MPRWDQESGQGAGRGKGEEVGRHTDGGGGVDPAIFAGHPAGDSVRDPAGGPGLGWQVEGPWPG